MATFARRPSLSAARFALAAVALLFITRDAGAQTFTLTLNNDPTGIGRGTVTSTPAGISCTLANGDARTCSQAFAAGTVVTLTAVPIAGVAFSGWSGACTGTGTCQVTMSQARTVYAKFTPTANVTLTVVMTGNGSGRAVARDFRGVAPKIACIMTLGVQSGTCSGQYPMGTTAEFEVLLSIDQASVFRGWTPTCDPYCRVVMDGNKTISAQFQVPELQVVAAAGTGSGRITAANGNIDCVIAPSGASGTCSAKYPQTSGTEIVLNASPTAPSVFSGWSGPCNGTNSTCTIQGLSPYTAPTLLVAQFSLPDQRLVVAGAGAGAGAVTSTPAGISCAIAAGAASGACEKTFTAGASVTLTPNANSGSRFAGWSGACTNGTGTCQVTMSAERAVTARFEPFVPAVSVTVSGAGGAVTSTPAGISCRAQGAGTCTATFSTGTTVALAAQPDAGWVFSSWSGACSGGNACQFTMGQQDRSVGATFTRAPVALTVNGSGSGTATVTSQPAGINCAISGAGKSGACEAPFAVGSTVTLTALPAAGTTFNSWSDPGCPGTGPCAVTMAAARSITATFTGPLVTLTVLGAGTGDGVVTSTPSGLACTVAKGVAAAAVCSTGVAPGGAVTLTADPRDGSVFAGWTGGGCATQPACAVTLTQATTVTARFTAPKAASLVAAALLGGPALAADEQAQLDRFGNADGRFNLGDLVALLDRTGERLSPAALAALAQRERVRRE